MGEKAVASHMNATGQPFQDDNLLKARHHREMLASPHPFNLSRQTFGRFHTSLRGGKDLDNENSAAPYRLPLSGEPVTIWGLRSRQELNGARGEIVSETPDHSGRVKVSLISADGTSRRMRIQPRKLFASCSSPALLGEDDVVSICSLRGGTSRVPSRPGSSATLGSSARSLLTANR
mmetsp:Transcript_130704/g.326109  ORF Transcript_130704/g.326109 Transcript_130704/m.326109 type:complete len:177 (+) Transcript_130704:100-630(+)